MLQHRRYKRVLGLAVCAILLALPTLGICIGPPRDSFGLMPFIDEQAMRDYATYMRDPTEGLHLNTWLYSEVLIKTNGKRPFRIPRDLPPDIVGSPSRGSPSWSVLNQRNEFNLQVTYKLNDNISFYTWLRPFYDSIFDLKGGSSTGRNGRLLRNRWGNNFDFGNDARSDPLVREAYVDLNFDKFFARLGRQLVAWGKSDGFYLLDQVTPINFRQPFKFEEQDFRIPQWMLNFSYRFGTAGTVQLLWLPDPQFAEFPGNSPSEGCRHDWTAPGTCLTNQVLTAFDQIFKAQGVSEGFPFIRKKPANTLANSAVGVRFDSEYEGLTFSLAYLYKYPWFLIDFPGVDGKRCQGRGCAARSTSDIRTSARIHIIGAALDYQFSNFLGIEKVVLRNESALYLDDIFYLPTTDVVQKNHFQTMWGLDKFAVDPQFLRRPSLAWLGFGATPWFLSFQLWQDWIINPDRWGNAYIDSGANNFSFDTFRVTNGLRNAVKTFVTFYVSKDLLADQTLHWENFIAAEPHFNDFWEHVQFKYDWNDYVELIVGYDTFFGRADGALGSNKYNDYLYSSIKVGI
jgi:hypothetical protein